MNGDMVETLTTTAATASSNNMIGTIHHTLLTRANAKMSRNSNAKCRKNDGMFIWFEAIWGGGFNRLVVRVCEA
jgi:hypothetical protein